MARGQHGFSGVYNSSAITLSDEEGAALALDSAGRVITSPPVTPAGDDLVDDAVDGYKVTLATQIAGEDLTNDVIKTEQRYSYSRLAADGQVKAGAGFIHTLTFACADAAPTAGSIIVYDSLTETGTVIYSETFDTTAFRGYSVLLDVSFATGCYVGFTTTADVGITVSYR